ncbi:MAG: flagellar hook-length control protein FliK, partial [Fimbriimonadales bacterium]|nr:flagellar hook-length control protein FliK [Fimbriimonadales bacterium]
DLKKGDNRGKVPALTNLRPTLFFAPLREGFPETTNGEQLYTDVVGDDAKAPQGGKRVDTPAPNNAPDVFKKEHVLVLSSAVADNRGGTYKVMADENGTTLTVPGKEDADPVPSLFHNGGKKENKIPTKVLPSLRGPAPEPVHDLLSSEAPRLSLSPELHFEKGDVKESPSESEKPSLQPGEGKRFPLPFNLTPELHSALKRYGRVVSAEVLSLREYAQKLLSKGISVEEIVKILNSMGEESPRVSLPEEHKQALFLMVHKIKSALEGMRVEEALSPQRDVRVPTLFPHSPDLLLRGESPTLPARDEVVVETPGGIGERETSALRPESVRGDLAPVMAPPAMLSEVGRRQPVPVSAQPTLWHSVAERLARLMESDQVKTLELRLDPPELGRVHLTVHAWGNRIDAEISVSHGEVRQYLEAHREQIAMALQSRGLELASLTVSSQGRQGGFEDYGFSQGLTWSAPLPLSEVPLLVGLPWASSSGGLDVRA